MSANPIAPIVPQMSVPPGRHPVRVALCRAVEAAMQVVIDVRDAQKADARHDIHLVASKRHLQAARLHLLGGDPETAARHTVAAYRLIEEAERADAVEDGHVARILRLARHIAGSIEALLIAPKGGRG